MNVICLIFTLQILNNWLYRIESFLTSWKFQTDSCSATQEIPWISWELQVHYSVHNCSPFVWILNQMTSVHALPLCSLGCILMLSSHLHLGLLSSLFPSGLPTKFLYPFPHHACHLPHPSYSLWFHNPNNI